MFTIKTRQDVLAVAKTFGTAALDHVLANSTINADANRAIIECREWAANEVIKIEHVNDGNTVYEIDASFTATKAAGFYCTGLDEIIIVRTGMGNYTLSLHEAMRLNEISVEQCANLLAEITARNVAAGLLF